MYLSCCQMRAWLLILLIPAPSLYFTVLLCCPNYRIQIWFVSICCQTQALPLIMLNSAPSFFCCSNYKKKHNLFCSILMQNAGFALHTVKSFTVFVSHHLVMFQLQNPHLFCIYLVAKHRLCLSYWYILHRLCISLSRCAIPTTNSPSVLYLSCCQTQALPLILIYPAPFLYLAISLCYSYYKIPICFVSILLPNISLASHTAESCTSFESHHLVVLFQLQNPHLSCIYIVAKHRLCVSYC